MTRMCWQKHLSSSSNNHETLVLNFLLPSIVAYLPCWTCRSPFRIVDHPRGNSPSRCGRHSFDRLRLRGARPRSGYCEMIPTTGCHSLQKDKPQLQFLFRPKIAGFCIFGDFWRISSPKRKVSDFCVKISNSGQSRNNMSVFMTLPHYFKADVKV